MGGEINQNVTNQQSRSIFLFTLSPDAFCKICKTPLFLRTINPLRICGITSITATHDNYFILQSLQKKFAMETIFKYKLQKPRHANVLLQDWAESFVPYGNNHKTRKSGREEYLHVVR